MVAREKYALIRTLKLQGKSLRTIAREAGVAINTVRKYLRSDHPPTYGPRPSKPWKIDPFREYVKIRLESARPGRISVATLFLELREKGYKGGISRLKTLISGLLPRTSDFPNWYERRSGGNGHAESGTPEAGIFLRNPKRPALP